MKKWIALLMATVLVFAGCGKKETSGETSSQPTSGSATEEKTMYKVGISQFVQHDALDQSRLGFIEGLAEEGFVEGENLTIDYQNAQGEIPNTTTIATKLTKGGNDLVLAIGTPSAQAMVNATKEVPVVVTAITDPADAQLVASNEKPGGNVTGSSDMAPIEKQIELAIKIAPEAKTIGILFNSGESNSRIQADMAIEAIEGAGLTAKEYTISEPSQIPQVAGAALKDVDVLYTPTDNMVAAGMPTIASLAIEKKVPLIGGEKGQVENGALATYGLDYFELGKISGKQAARILKGENPAEMPIEYQTNFELTINEETREKLGITLPEDVK